MPGFGSNAYLAICRQNSGGATAPSSWYNVPFANHGLDWNPEELLDDSISGNPDTPNRVLGYTRAAGPIVANVHPIILGHFLRGLCGQSSPAAAGSAFVHTFNPKLGDFSGVETLPPYAFQVHQGDASVNSAYLYQDSYINTFELSVAAGAFVRGTWGVVGKDCTLITKAPPPAWDAGITPFKWSQTSLQIGGAAVTRYRDFRFTFDNRIAGQDRINNTTAPAYHFRDGFRSFARFSGTADIAQTDWLNVKNETALAVDVYIKGAASISPGHDEYLRLQVPRLKLTKHPTGVAGPGIVTVTIDGMAEYHSGSATVCTFTLCNTFASYNT